ncbi:MAG: peptide chain release factor 2 [Proteobacteria bacterium]|nr:peptide chain release factor 2 [Cystobacterineae bacterium]MCL2259713.1 peptide chain release factor 2 [Cystobacterineae bacterium]MCL2313674.1 peptide chain release factor 2 [Pseudomonadota bacterium]
MSSLNETELDWVDIEERLQGLRGAFDVERKRSDIARIEQEASLPGFWDAPVQAQNLLKQKTEFEHVVRTVEQAGQALEDAKVLWELGQEAKDAPTLEEARAVMAKLEESIRGLELQRMLSEKTDRLNCFMDINAGAGGTESMDWAAMLMRMYMRYCEQRGWKVEMNDMVEGEEAGYKNVSFRVEGAFAYGYLKAEIGIHRLVRISPFDSNARRHTSFAAIDVYPELDDEVRIDIPEKDVELKFIRGGGAGGQKVNKTSSTAQLRHLPSGMVVTCQTERSQSANREMAFKILKARLYDLEMKKRQEAKEVAEAAKADIAFGSQIRSYVLAPYRLIKDLRTGIETGNVDKVLDGDLDAFIVAQLMGVKNPNRTPTDSG